MTKFNDYRLILRDLDDWEPYLLEHSGLPGARANLELAQAAAEEGTEAFFMRCLAAGPAEAPVNTPAVFPVVCAVIGLGRLVAEGKRVYLSTLQRLACDPRWRVREAVAMALQRVGDADMHLLLDEMERWVHQQQPEEESLLIWRAVAAGLCEPRLLRDEGAAARTLKILDAITTGLLKVQDRKSEPFRVLRQGLAYCWSVAVVALPAQGKPFIEKWAGSDNADARWIMKENLKKKRLAVMDAAWVESCLKGMESRD